MILLPPQLLKSGNLLVNLNDTVISMVRTGCSKEEKHITPAMPCIAQSLRILNIHKFPYRILRGPPWSSYSTSSSAESISVWSPSSSPLSLSGRESKSSLALLSTTLLLALCLVKGPCCSGLVEGPGSWSVQWVRQELDGWLLEVLPGDGTLCWSLWSSSSCTLRKCL